MNQLVKFYSDDDGDEIEYPVWHLVTVSCSDLAALCTGEYFGYGSSSVVYEEKTVKRGGITCPMCLDKIKEIKAVKL